ncbi:MAG: hypothetical protein GX683_05230 [Ruminococcaceae bacterium]|nr:hypothetical protein [Oscillospiraceae bacterium]
MKKNVNEFYELLANMFGVFDTDWQSDFEDDGYDDYFAREAVDAPLFVSDIANARCISLEVVRGRRRA